MAGNRVGLAPFNTITLWNKLSINDRLAIGVGVINQAHTFASSDDTVQLPWFTRADAGVFCKINDMFFAQANIENVLARRYVATADGNNNITPGAPRTIRFQLTARF